MRINLYGVCMALFGSLCITVFGYIGRIFCRAELYRWRSYRGTTRIDSSNPFLPEITRRAGLEKKNRLNFVIFFFAPKLIICKLMPKKNRWAKSSKYVIFSFARILLFFFYGSYVFRNVCRLAQFSMKSKAYEDYPSRSPYRTISRIRRCTRVNRSQLGNRHFLFLNQFATRFKRSCLDRLAFFANRNSDRHSTGMDAKITTTARNVGGNVRCRRRHEDENKNKNTVFLEKTVYWISNCLSAVRARCSAAGT